MRISLIVACGRNRVIGIENRLPWNLPDDLKYFRQKTSGHPVIMGRKTFESIGRPLPNRLNVVITRQAGYQREGITVTDSLEEAILAARASGTDEAFIIGGAEIYTQAISHADRLYVTWVDVALDGDAYFPEWRNHPFHEVSRTHHPKDSGHDYDFDFIVLDRTEN